MRSLILCFTLLGAFCAEAQDERFVRDLFAGDVLRTTDEAEEVKAYHFRVQSPLYQVDLTGDYRNESLVIEKRDGEDWIHIHDYHLKRVFSYRLLATASGSSLYRMRLIQLSEKTRLLLLYFFEGANEYLKKRSTARFYFLTIDGADLGTISVTRGPAFWDELQEGRDRIYRRRYQMDALDLNQDGTKELVYSYEHIRSVFTYQGSGKWLEH